jgi:hypothetical protein
MDCMKASRVVVSVVISLVIILGPTLFMASSPCLDCAGICGTAGTVMPIEVRAVFRDLPVSDAPDPEVQLPPVRLVELPPRPLPTTA